MTTISNLSNDAWCLICSYLNLEQIALLYATNDRLLMRRLVGPGVASNIEISGSISSNATRFLCDNRSLKQFTWNGGSMASTEEPKKTVPSLVDFPVPMRLLRAISQANLTNLQITGNIIEDTDYPIAEGETFASLFPNLASLNFPASPQTSTTTPGPTSQNDANMGLLLTKLPPSLQSLSMIGANSPLATLPSSLTSLTIFNACGVPLYTKPNHKYPTLMLLELLHEKTPSLTHLSTRVACHRTQIALRGFAVPQASPNPSKPFLPRLTSLTLSLYASEGAEYAAVIKCLPSVRTLKLNCAYVSFGPSTLPEPQARQRARPNAFSPLPSVFPMNLSELQVTSSMPGFPTTDSRPALSQDFFSSLPHTLLGLKLISCNIEWSQFQESSVWDEEEADPGDTYGFGRGRGGLALAAMRRPDTSADDAKVAWASLLPPSVVSLHAERVPIHISQLPAQLRSLSVSFPSNEAELYIRPSSTTPWNIQPLTDSNRRPWPKGLTSLNIDYHCLSPNESLHLPRSLTSLSTPISCDWTQEHVAHLLLKVLPDCFVTFTPYRGCDGVWITNPTSDSPKGLKTPSSIYNASSMDIDPHQTMQEDFKNSDLDVLRFATLQLSNIPRRINTQWTIASSRTLGDGETSVPTLSPFPPPKFDSPLTVPNPSSVRKVTLPRHKINRFSHGTLYTPLQSVSSMLSDAKNIESISLPPSSDEISMQDFDDSYTDPIELSWFQPFQCLTTLKLRGQQNGPLHFSLLPRTLICFETGAPPRINVYSLPDSFLYGIAAKNKAKTAVIGGSSVSGSSFSGSQSPSLLSAPQLGETGDLGDNNLHWNQFSRPDTQENHGCIGDLPRGLTRCSILGEALVLPLDHSLWPPGLIDLEIEVYGWEDTQILEIQTHLPKLKTLGVSGIIISFGVLDREKVLDYTYKAESQSPFRQSLRGVYAGAETADGTTSQILLEDPLATPASSESILREFGSLEVLDWNHTRDKLNERLARRLGDRKIELRGIRVFHLPSALLLGSPKLTRSIILTPEAEPQFNVKFSLHTEQKIPVQFQQLQQTSRQSQRSCGLRCYHVMKVSSLRAYTSLTSLTISITDLSWERISWLPKSLKHLSCCLLDNSETTDPFHNCPRQLETLCIDTGIPIMLTADGVPQLPPNLTTLECNQLSFSPSLIDIFPRKISTLLFNGHNSWSDLHIYRLATSQLESVRKISVNLCVLSGALVPLDPSITAITISSIMNMTVMRLGDRIKVHRWSDIASPLRLYELDLSASLLSNSPMNYKIPMESSSLDHLTSIDLSRAAIGKLSDLFPFSMPSRLTSLSVTSISHISPTDFYVIPKSLTSLSWVKCGALGDMSTFWSQLPRGLLSLTIELESSFARFDLVDPCPITIHLDLLLQPLSADSQLMPKFNPTVLPRLHCLPRGLQRLSLRPFFLLRSCILDFGDSLTELHCASLEPQTPEDGSFSLHPSMAPSSCLPHPRLNITEDLLNVFDYVNTTSGIRQRTPQSDSDPQIYIQYPRTSFWTEA